MAEKSEESKADTSNDAPEQAAPDSEREPEAGDGDDGNHGERDDDGGDDDDDDERPSTPEATDGGSSEDDDDAPRSADAEKTDAEKAGAKKTGKQRAAKKKASGAKRAGKKRVTKRASSKKSSGGRKARKDAKGARRARKSGTPTRNIIFFVLVVGGIAAAFAVLGNQTGGGRPAAPKWKIGETVDVEITLVGTDKRNLACAMKGEVKGRHCAFEAQNKRRGAFEDPSKGDKLLQPYTSTTGVQLMAAGLWAQPSLKANLPKSRFSVKCKFVVEDKAKTAFVQWKPGEGWHPANGWFTGVVKDCGTPQGQK